MAYKCVNCGNDLAVESGNHSTCNSCETVYYQVNNIPIFLSDGISYFNENYASIQTHKRRTINYINNRKGAFKHQSKRMPYYEILKDGLITNMALYDMLLHDLEPFTSADYLANASYSSFENEPLKGKEINYLIRDWGGLKESEKEVQNILDPLKTLISEYAVNSNSIFFAGSGTGRFAYELAPDFNQVYCTDLSYRMVQFSDYILRGKQLNASIISLFVNIYSPDEVAKEVVLGLEDIRPTPNISTFVSDIKSIPLQSASVDVFASIYFLDVLTIEHYIEEVRRVLTDDGIYINIGPIGYPGNDLANNLLPSEIKIVFENHGFVIEHESFLETPYMKFEHELSTVMHSNWILVARKKPSTEQVNLTAESVLKIDQPIFSERQSEISETGENVFHNRLYYPDGTAYEDADLFIEILYLIDGERTVKNVLDLIEETHGVAISFDELHPFLLDFMKHKTLRIVSA